MNALNPDIHATLPSYFSSLNKTIYPIKCFWYPIQSPKHNLMDVNNDVIAYKMRILFTIFYILFIFLCFFLSVVSCFSTLNMVLTTAKLNTTYTNILLCEFNWHEAKVNSTEHKYTHTRYNLFESPWMVEVRSTQVVPDGHESSSKILACSIKSSDNRFIVEENWHM